MVPDSSPRAFGRVRGFGQRVFGNFPLVAFPPGTSGRLPGGYDNSSVGVVRLQKKYSEARTPFLFVLVMMASAALQPVLMPRCPACRVSALLSLVALRRAVRGQSASADAGQLSVQGLSFTLFGHVSAQ